MNPQARRYRFAQWLAKVFVFPLPANTVTRFVMKRVIFRIAGI